MFICLLSDCWMFIEGIFVVYRGHVMYCLSVLEGFLFLCL